MGRRDPNVGILTVIAATCTLFLGLICWPTLLGKVYIYGDFGAFHLPLRTFIHQQMQSGVLPLWKPDSFSGFYLHGDGQAGLFHPIHLLAYPYLDPLFEIQLEATFWYTILLAGCFALFRRWGVSPAAALLGGAVFAFSGFSRMHVQHVNAMAVIAHVPWLLFLADHFYGNYKGLARFSTGIALLNGSAILMGYPPFYFFALLFQIWYILWFQDQANWRGRTLHWCVAILAGVLLGAPQWLPTLSAVHGSGREVASSSFILNGSWHPLNLFGLVNPMLFTRGFVGDHLPDEMNIYPGVGVLLLVAYAIGNQTLRAQHRRAFRMLAILAAFGFILSLGRYGKLYELWLRIPVVRGFRVPVRYFCMVQFAIAGVAALALDPFLRLEFAKDWRRRYLPALIIGVTALLTCGFAYSRAKEGPDAEFIYFLRTVRAEFFTSWQSILVGVAGVLIACAVYALAARSSRFWATVVVVLVLADLVWYTGSLWLSYPIGTAKDLVAETYDPGVPPPSIISPPDDSEPSAYHGPRKLYYKDWSPNLYSLAGYRSTSGYAALIPSGILPAHSDTYKILMGSKAIWRDDSGWQTVKDPLPEVRLVNEIVISSHPEIDIARIDFRRQALVREPLSVDPLAKGVVEELEISTQEKTITTEASGPMFCVLAQRFHPGWKAVRDGESIPLLAVNGDLTGFIVPPGRHVTELRFEPAELRAGFLLASVGLIVTAAAAFAVRRLGVAGPAVMPVGN